MPASAGDDPSEASRRAEWASAVEAGNTAYADGQLAEAAAAWVRAHKLIPTVNLLFNLGRIHEDLKDRTRATEFYQEFVDAPDVPADAKRQALERLGAFRFDEKDYVAALSFYQRAHDAAPSPTGRYHVARALEEQGKLTEALTIYGEIAGEPKLGRDLAADVARRLEASQPPAGAPAREP